MKIKPVSYSSSGRRWYPYLFSFALLAALLAAISPARIFYFPNTNLEVLSNVCGGSGEPVTLIIVGDLLIGRGRVWREIIRNNYGPVILGNYFDAFSQSDAVFANFEGILTNEGAPRPKSLPAQFSLGADPEIIRFLPHLGNITLSFANNHSADFGHAGIQDTLALLKDTSVGYVGIGHDGQEALTPHIIETSGIRIALVALTDLLPREYYASDAHGGIAELSAENLRKAIGSARQSSDFVIVSLHTAEDIVAPFSFRPDSRQQRYSRLAIDYGADVVVGQHAHGLQTVERYRGKFIFYSLGLFLYDPSVSKRYPPAHPLYEATQFNGGGVLSLAICPDGRYTFNLTATQVIDRGQRLIVTPVPSPIKLEAIIAAGFQLLDSRSQSVLSEALRQFDK